MFRLLKVNSCREILSGALTCCTVVEAWKAAYDCCNNEIVSILISFMSRYHTYIL